MNSIPAIDHDVEWLEAIPGQVPAIDESLSGCEFHPRCIHSKSLCETTEPVDEAVAENHLVRCHFANQFAP